MEEEDRQELESLEGSAVGRFGDALKYLSWAAVVWTIGGLGYFGVPWYAVAGLWIPIPMVVWLGLMAGRLALFVLHDDFRRLRNLQRDRAIEEGVDRGYD